MWKTRNRLDELQQRKEMVKCIKNKKQDHESLVIPTKIEKMYEYYK